MKKTVFTIAVICSSLSFAQIAIGKQSITNTSVSLEFADDVKGIILPYVENPSAISEQGTLYVDAATGRVKMKLATGLMDFSSEDPLDTNHNGILDLAPQTGANIVENVNAKTIIGATTSVADGVLVLESSDKAMILPKLISPELNIQNPSAGMMIYDPFRKMLCFYNGKEWSYWEGVAN